MEGRPPFAVVQALGYTGPDTLACFPPLILDTISADLLLACDPKDGNELLSHYTHLLTHLGWKSVHRETREGREARYAMWPRRLPEPVQQVLGRRFPQGLYRHQAVALEAFRQGQHVAMTTAIASGKSLVFYLAALTILHREPTARIAALYFRRWRHLMHLAGNREAPIFKLGKSSPEIGDDR